MLVNAMLRAGIGSTVGAPRVFHKACSSLLPYLAFPLIAPCTWAIWAAMALLTSR